MTASGARLFDQDGRVERLIAERVEAGSDAWFPQLARGRIRVTTLSARPTCTIFAVSLTDDGTPPQVLAKARRDTPGVEPRRPRLHPRPATALEHTLLEHSGLASIRTTFLATEPGFGTIRPLDLVPDEPLLLMDYVGEGTLRNAFVYDSRLLATVRRRTPAAAWRNVGAWLRRFHESGALVGRPEQQATRAEVVDLFGQYGDYLSDRLGRLDLRDAASGGAALAARSLPDRLPLVVGHGDFAPRNMFVTTEGRITVFDPMPRWCMPRYEDVCRFLVGMRLTGLQLRSWGLAYSRDALVRRERWFLSGYFGQDPVPAEELRCYLLLVLLDKWAALAEAQGRGGSWRGRTRAALMRPVHEYLAREARRLVESDPEALVRENDT